MSKPKITKTAIFLFLYNIILQFFWNNYSFYSFFVVHLFGLLTWFFIKARIFQGYHPDFVLFRGHTRKTPLAYFKKLFIKLRLPTKSFGPGTKNGQKMAILFSVQKFCEKWKGIPGRFWIIKTLAKKICSFKNFLTKNCFFLLPRSHK